MTNKEKLLAILQNLLDKKINFSSFSSLFEEAYWADGVHSTLEEVDNEFFYRVSECSTFVNNEEAGNWGFKSEDEYAEWLGKTHAEFMENKNTWYERVKNETDMWA